MTGPTRHNNQLHRSHDAAGDPITDGWVPAADGLGNWVWVDPTTLPPPASALDDLTDVTITGATLADRLRFDGTGWRNSALIWTPVMALDPVSGNYLPVVSGDGDAIMAEA